MRLPKKFLAILLAVLLTTSAIIIPISAVFAATAYTVTLSAYSGPPNTAIYAYGAPVGAGAFTLGDNYTIYMNAFPVTGAYPISSTTGIVSYFGIPIWPRGVYSVTITTSAGE